MRAIVSGALVLLAIGCGTDGAATNAADETTADTTDTTDVVTSGTSGEATSFGGSGVADAGDTETGNGSDDGVDDGGYEEDDGGDGCSFTCPDPPGPSTPPGGVCGLATQNCPEGEKCMPWANDGGSLWNAVRCSPVENNPNGVGEPCTVDGSGVSGLDDCDLGLQCFNVDPDTNEGTCAQICGAIDGAPICPEDTFCATYAAARVCLAACDPLGFECPIGYACYPAGTFVGPDEPLPPFFTCERVVAAAESLEPCEIFHGACQGGSLCFESEALPCNRGYAGCCTELCTLQGMDECPDGLTCTPYLDPAPNALLEGVGVCLGT